jgi:3-hydroxyisobutyrate dehydrogenase
MSNIGFIDLGNMGMPMAINLFKAGHQIKAFDTADAIRKTAADEGMEVVKHAADAAKSVEFIITMLPSGPILLSVLEEIIPVTNKGTVLIDCSTVDVSSALKAHQIANDNGLLSLDSPVSGGITGAQAGTLTLMIGGETNTFNKAKDVLDVFAGKLVHCGKGGAGQSAKICNNMLLGITMIGLSEAFVLGEKLGLEPQALFDAMSTSSGSCWSLLNYCPVAGIGTLSPADNDFKPGFTAELMLKDLRLSQQAAEDMASATPMGKHATEFYKQFVKEGLGEKDFSAVITQLKTLKRS